MTPAAEAVNYLAFTAGWGGGFFPVYLDGELATHVPADGRARLAERVAGWDLRQSRQVEIGLPEAREGGGQIATTVLWAWVESRRQALQLARSFRPLPNLVLRMGGSCRRLCLWALDEQVPYVLAESGNKRVAYALHAPQKYARPESLRIPMPGTFLRVGRRRPAPVLVTRMELKAFHRSQVVAGLREPPPPYAQRMREKGLWR